MMEYLNSKNKFNKIAVEQNVMLWELQQSLGELMARIQRNVSTNILPEESLSWFEIMIRKLGGKN